MTRLWNLLVFLSRTGLPVAMLGLHFIVCACYARRWDKVSALTILPIWAWCLAALSVCLFSWILHRGKGAKWIGLLWLVTGIVWSEETRFLIRTNVAELKPGAPEPYEAKKVIRVVTLNCRGMNPASVEEVAKWSPDIIMLQEAPQPYQLEALKKKLYPSGGNVAGAYDCCILTRGVITLLQIQGTPGMPSNSFEVLPAVVNLDGKQFHVVSVHLQGAVTDLSFHKLSTWQKHYINRLSRRAQLVQIRNRLAVNRVLTEGPVLLGGDFNAPSEDAVLRELRADFTDAMDAVGGGWPDTFPNDYPAHRIDHLFCNSQCQPVRARTVKTANSDHRMVIADFIVP